MPAMNVSVDPQLESLRTPPHSIEAEQSVLGGLLLDNAAWDRIGDLLGQDETYTKGLNVYTTITSTDQEAAYRAVRDGVMDYEKRHGFRGPEGYMEIPAPAVAADDVIQLNPVVVTATSLEQNIVDAPPERLIAVESL